MNLLTAHSIGSEIVAVRVGGATDDGTSSDPNPEATTQEEEAEVTALEGKATNENTTSAETSISLSDGNTSNGVNERVFYIHKNVLGKSSAFLQKRMKTEWSGTSPRPIDLTDEDPDNFEIYLQWLYSQMIAMSQYPEDSDKDFDVFAQLYLLGEKLMDCTFQNRVLDAIIHMMEETVRYPSDDFISKIYKGTVKASPARKLMVDIWVYKARLTWNVANTVEDAGAEFANDVIAAFIKYCDFLRRTEKGPWVNNPELYYVTAGDENGQIEGDSNV